MRAVLVLVFVAGCGGPPVGRCDGPAPRCVRALDGRDESIAADCVAGHWMCAAGTSLPGPEAAPRRAAAPSHVAPPSPSPSPPVDWRAAREHLRRALDPDGRCRGDPPLCFDIDDEGLCGDVEKGAECDRKHRRWRCLGGVPASRCKHIGL